MTGRARVFGDDVNTDYVITSRRKRESIDPQFLRRYVFEELDPAFAATLDRLGSEVLPDRVNRVHDERAARASVKITGAQNWLSPFEWFDPSWRHGYANGEPPTGSTHA